MGKRNRTDSRKAKAVARPFEITYIDPDTGESVAVVKSFKDTVNPYISAMEWAEDYAYQLSDKGKYEVRDLHGNSNVQRDQ